MNGGRLIRRSLRFYAGEHALTALAAAVAAAVLAGALIVGDSLSATLSRLARLRTGRVGWAVESGERLFAERLAAAVRAQLAPRQVAAALALPGTVETGDGSRRAGRVQVLGVDAAFTRLTLEPRSPGWPDGVYVNAALARRLGVRSGDEVLVRFSKPGRVSRDMALAAGADPAVALRTRVAGVLGDASGGRFSLSLGRGEPALVYMPLPQLQALADAAGQINLLLGEGSDQAAPEAALRSEWQPDDVGLTLREIPERTVVELRSRQVYIDEAVARSAMELSPPGSPVLTMLVNGLESDGRTTPYSFVCGSGDGAAKGLGPGEIALTDWAAGDLGIGTGQPVRLTYYVLGPLRTLMETSTVFTVRRICPLAEVGDPTLMPDFPGVAGSGSCRDWESGLPIDLGRIRPKDEAYWDSWHGAPKAFVALGHAQALWATPWGRVTAIRWPSGDSSTRALGEGLRARLDPAGFGLAVRDVAGPAQRAISEAMDFRQLFLGLSLFLIVAALMLVWLLFRLSLERRQAQAGLLLALGAGRALAVWLFVEGVAVASVGAAAGVVGGVVYARVLVGGLGAGWRGAVAGVEIILQVQPATLALAWGVTVLAAALVVALGVRTLRRRNVHALLAGTGDPLRAGRARCWGWTALATLTAAALLALLAPRVAERERAGLFFGIAALGLTGLGALLGWSLRRERRGGPGGLTPAGLGRREAARHPGRSVLVAGLTAAAMFLLGTVALNAPERPARYDRGSGTGGFAWIADLALPLHADLNLAAGRRAFGLDEADLAGVSFVGLRVHAADDASCLNLNRAQQPQVAGVDPEALARRGAFRFVRTDLADRPAAAEGWRRLEADCGEDVVPAVADEPTLVWGLGKAVGDDLAMRDAQGRSFRLRFVGMLDASILQGSVVIADRHFVARFPAESGHTALLVDAPESRAGAVGALLTRVFRREGLACTSSVDRFAEFSAVTAAYLAIFRTLGGFGILLGVAGLAAVLARQVVERRGALALLRAVGFRRGRLIGLLVSEPLWLALAGLAGGLGAALLASAPSWNTPPPASTWAGLAGWALVVAAAGGVATWVTALRVTRGAPFEALRDE